MERIRGRPRQNLQEPKFTVPVLKGCHLASARWAILPARGNAGPPICPGHNIWKGSGQQEREREKRNQLLTNIWEGSCTAALAFPTGRKCLLGRPGDGRGRRALCQSGTGNGNARPGEGWRWKELLEEQCVF